MSRRCGTPTTPIQAGTCSHVLQTAKQRGVISHSAVGHRQLLTRGGFHRWLEGTYRGVAWAAKQHSRTTAQLPRTCVNTLGTHTLAPRLASLSPLPVTGAGWAGRRGGKERGGREGDTTARWGGLRRAAVGGSPYSGHPPSPPSSLPPSRRLIPLHSTCALSGDSPSPPLPPLLPGGGL